MDKGEIKEIGTHEQLLQLQGYYFKLHQMQFERQEKIA
jgi:ATP-binding cassette subfamily B protein